MKNFKWIVIFLSGGCLSFFWLCSEVKPFLFLLPEKEVEQNINNGIYIHNSSEKNHKDSEVFLGLDMESELNKYIDTKMLYFNETADRDYLIHIYLRGFMQFSPPFVDVKHINIAYLIYPVYFSKYDKKKVMLRDRTAVANYGYVQVLFDELQFYDVLAVASRPYVKKLRQAGFKAYYVPQFTNTDKFYPDYDESLKSEILFVGGRAHMRQAPMIMLKHNLPIDIYGPDSGGLAKANFIANDILRKYYSSAKIVLNAHREDMRLEGFINNRTFDVTACETLLISDYIPEIEEIYGDSVPMWKTEEELVNLVKYYLDPAHEEERKEKAKRAREITLKNFTAKNMANAFKMIIANEKKEKAIND